MPAAWRLAKEIAAQWSHEQLLATWLKTMACQHHSHDQGLYLHHCRSLRFG